MAAAVSNTVKARADEIVKSVVETDWKNELSAFGKEVGEESKTLKTKTAELVEHLPDAVEHQPGKVKFVQVQQRGAMPMGNSGVLCAAQRPVDHTTVLHPPSGPPDRCMHCMPAGGCGAAGVEQHTLAQGSS